MDWVCQGRRLTHTACDVLCNFLDRDLGAESRGRPTLFNLKDSFRFSTLFRQIGWNSKRTGHLGWRSLVSQQTYPHVLWDKKDRRFCRLRWIPRYVASLTIGRVRAWGPTGF